MTAIIVVQKDQKNKEQEVKGREDLENFPKCERCGGRMVQLWGVIWRCVKCNRCVTYGFVNEDGTFDEEGTDLSKLQRIYFVKPSGEELKISCRI